jgi:hypothetical protein
MITTQGEVPVHDLTQLLDLASAYVQAEPAIRAPPTISAPAGCRSGLTVPVMTSSTHRHRHRPAHDGRRTRLGTGPISAGGRLVVSAARPRCTTGLGVHGGAVASRDWSAERSGSDHPLGVCADLPSQFPRCVPPHRRGADRCGRRRRRRRHRHDRWRHVLARPDSLPDRPVCGSGCRAGNGADADAGVAQVRPPTSSSHPRSVTATAWLRSGRDGWSGIT